MSKEKEIKLLDELNKLGGYFADQFNKEQIGIMQQNIRNDFPILLNTDINMELSELRDKKYDFAKLEQQLKEFDNKNRSLNDLLGLMMEHLLQSSNDDLVYRFYKLDDIVKYKLDNKLILNDTDIEYLKSKF